VERYWPEVRGENESLQKPDTLESSDLITSRILWLEGLEPGFNSGVDAEGQVVDSYERYIYFHGTNHEDKIGTPVSKGCIRMLNTDVIELFDLVQVGDLVWIQE
jgi:lipoprotein-anchoring transpeptidase ErfK/SrfK